MRVFELLKKVGLQAILDSPGAVDFADEQVSLYCNLMLRKPVPTNGILCVLPMKSCSMCISTSAAGVITIIR